MGDTNFHMEMRSLKHQKSEFTMKVGKHSATVRVCMCAYDMYGTILFGLFTSWRGHSVILT